MASSPLPISQIATTKKRKKSHFHLICEIPLPHSPIFRENVIESVLKFHPRAKDVILSSFPKADTKWIEFFIWQLFHPGEQLPPVDNITCRYIPCLEMNGTEEALQQASPRLMKTYLPFKCTPWNKRSKYIYVVRNPWDTCLSFYHLLKIIDCSDETFNRFFHNFLSGEVAYGDFFEHVAAWIKHKNDENVLLLPYERIKANPRSSLFVVAAFLGDQYLQLLLTQENLANDILNYTNLDSPRRKVRTFSKLCCPDLTMSFEGDQDVTNAKDKALNLNFFTSVKSRMKQTRRKCSDRQKEDLKEKISEHFKDTELETLWLDILNNMC